VSVSRPFPSDRQHLSYDGCLEVKGEIIRTVLCCSVLCIEVVHSHKHSSLDWVFSHRPISLCLDSFVCSFVFVLSYCICVALL